MSVSIDKIETNKNLIKLTNNMKNNIIPAFPQSILIVGASGSGKTTLLLNLLTKKHFYKDYHDFIFLFSETAKLDDSFKILGLKEKHIFDTELEMIENTKIIYEAQKENIEKKGVENSPKILMIYEDLTTNEVLMRNKIFKALWTQGRHLNIQVISMIHKYKALPRTQRLSAMNIIYYGGSGDETQQLADDFTPPRYTKKEFIDIINYATNPDKNSEHNFLLIQTKLPFKSRYKKNFDLVLLLNK